MRVFKFGGASVKDATGVVNVAKVLSLYPEEKIVVVISAMGKMTNAFEGLVQSYFIKDGEKRNHLKAIKSYHDAILKELFPVKTHLVYQAVSKLYSDLEIYLRSKPGSNYDYEYDQIVCYGELLSSVILSHYLNERGMFNRLIAARDVILTDENFREGRVYWSASVRMVKQKLKDFIAQSEPDGWFRVTQGFVGRAPDGSLTTLGREGSDYTAAIFGHALDANEVVIWKDVAGLYDADPKVFPQANLIPEISYQETIELSYYGASIIHPKTIQPLENKKIPLKVKSFLNPQEKGTVIHDQTSENKLPSSVIQKSGQMLLSISSRDFSFIAEKNLQQIFSIFVDSAVRINMMQISAISFSVVIDDPQFKREFLFGELSSQYKVRYNENVRLITIRHPKAGQIESLTGKQEALIEQRSRHTYQGVFKVTEM
jgi:aspartate kinase